MSKTESIRRTEIITRAEYITLGITLHSKFQGAYLVLVHPNPEVQKLGEYALYNICDACGVSNPEDSSDIHDKPFPRHVWDAALEAERRQRGLMFTPKVRLFAEKPAPAVAPEPSETGRYVYVIACIDSDVPLCKIGIANSPEKRVKELSTASPHQLRVEAAMYSPQAAAVERAAHNHFSDLRRNGEWFGMPASDAIRFVHSQVLEGAV